MSRICRYCGRIALAMFIAMTPLTAFAQQWTTIRPGKTTIDEVIAAFGLASSIESVTEVVTVARFENTAEATLLRVGFDRSRVVQAITVEPSDVMTEADVMSIYGLVKKSLGSSGSGLRLVAYPVGGAQAEYDRDGHVVRLSVSGGIATEGLSMQGLLRSFLSGKKPGSH